jgi:23S rRNA pseudouridine1911/1915/1917 synthase
MSEKLCVQEAIGLLALLNLRLSDWSRKTIKQRLQAGCVRVNGASVVRHDYALQVGDLVEVSATPRPDGAKRKPLAILYADPDLIAIDKPAGLLAVGTAQENHHHALALLRDQLSRRSPGMRLWPVHRIDQGTSGVLLFATSREMREAVMANWAAAEKTYLAVVEGRPDPACGMIDQPLRPDEGEYRMHVGAHPGAKPALTHYATERTEGGRSLLRVRLETGRQHQIRAHMAWLGCPVVGDPRYGAGGGRMGLHALRLGIIHPATGNALVFEAPIPADFRALMKPPGLSLPCHE